MKSLIAVVVALIVLGGGWYWYSQNMAPASVTNNTVINTNTDGTDNTPATTTDSSADAADGVSGGVSADINAGVTTGSVPTKATVSLTSSGFSPKSVTIKKGGTVTWTNAGTGGMWVASASHPTHTVYDGTTLQQHCTGATAFDECKNANTYSFTFTKVGSWNYHNHSNSSQFGTVVVVE